MSSEDDFVIGPKLPPQICKDELALEVGVSSCENSERISSEPSSAIGPVLPPHLLAKTSDAEKYAETDKSECDMYGPALPPNLKKIVQPSRAPDVNSFSKTLSNSESSEDESHTIGPFPEGSAQQMSYNQLQLEMRANYLKRKMAQEDSSENEKNKRESWMLELPPDKARNLGLGPRSFRMRAAPDMTDRSDWTDTPADKARKLLLGQDSNSKMDFEEEMTMAAIQERDKAMDKMVNKCKDEKRQLSLLEMHQKKLKKKQKEKKKKKEKPERRPFDRNIDLQANRFDEAQKKSIFKKAQLLDTRFSQGQSKYL